MFRKGLGLILAAVLLLPSGICTCGDAHEDDGAVTSIPLVRVAPPAHDCHCHEGAPDFGSTHRFTAVAPAEVALKFFQIAADPSGTDSPAAFASLLPQPRFHPSSPPLWLTLRTLLI